MKKDIITRTRRSITERERADCVNVRERRRREEWFEGRGDGPRGV